MGSAGAQGTRGKAAHPRHAEPCPAEARGERQTPRQSGASVKIEPGACGGARRAGGRAVQPASAAGPRPGRSVLIPPRHPAPEVPSRSRTRNPSLAFNITLFNTYICTFYTVHLSAW